MIDDLREAMLQLGREMAKERNADLSARLDAVMAQNERLLTVVLPLAKDEAADERAEEIAKEMERVKADHINAVRTRGGTLKQDWISALEHAAFFARSTITKPKEPPTDQDDVPQSAYEAGRDIGFDEGWMARDKRAKSAAAQDEAAIRADEREKIAEKFESGAEILYTKSGAARLARCGPKTREWVLEEALLDLKRNYEIGEEADLVVDRALGWKP